MFFFYQQLHWIPQMCLKISTLSKESSVITERLSEWDNRGLGSLHRFGCGSIKLANKPSLNGWLQKLFEMNKQMKSNLLS
ncbi:hypothetical protein L6452_13576 [Arctium lappa]|uniref:Uncharacterized protein n=1 Tax=Arctium lappa TaxID=4217 RepID=A0ACB9CIN6_ARCLA|nr:hypothetical protein L6452_13576 [Arctium lappa]